MAGLTEDRLRVVAIIHALKAVGIRVKNWKNFLNGDSNGEQTFIQVKKKTYESPWLFCCLNI